MCYGSFELMSNISGLEYQLTNSIKTNISKKNSDLCDYILIVFNFKIKIFVKLSFCYDDNTRNMNGY